MSTKYDLNNSKRYAPTGYEGDGNTDYVVPSCGVEDLDLAIFNLFDKQIPLYYDFHGEVKKVPVIFATGERFALLLQGKYSSEYDFADHMSGVDALIEKGIADSW